MMGWRALDERDIDNERKRCEDCWEWFDSDVEFVVDPRNANQILGRNKSWVCPACAYHTEHE